MSELCVTCCVCHVVMWDRVEGGEAMGQVVARLLSDDKPTQALAMLRAMAQAQVCMMGCLSRAEWCVAATNV